MVNLIQAECFTVQNCWFVNKQAHKTCSKEINVPRLRLVQHFLVSFVLKIAKLFSLQYFLVSFVQKIAKLFSFQVLEDGICPSSKLSVGIYYLLI